MANDFSLGSVETSLQPLERFEEYLQSRGKRITQQRRTLVNEVFAQHQHFDADALLGQLAHSEAGRKVSRPTVYRGLSELVEAGLLRKMTLNGRAVYEHDYGYPQHDHLYCEECGQLIEFQSEQLQEIRDAVGREHDFRVRGHRLIIHGVCRECAGKRQRKHTRLNRI